MSPEPDYFKLAKEITDDYIASMKIIYSQGMRDGLAEGKKIVDKVMGEKKNETSQPK